MVATSAAVLARMQRGGISALAPLVGLHALRSILGMGSNTVSALLFSAPQSAVFEGDSHATVEQGHHGNEPCAEST